MLSDILWCDISSVCIYDNYISVTDLIMTREYFAHREDKLHNRVHNHQTTWITEYFQPGRGKCVKGIFLHDYIFH